MEKTKAEGAKMAGKKIFLVEDDTFLSEMILQRLAPEGVALEHARSGEEALEKIPTFNPDLIVLDLVLPGMSGFEILEKVKAIPSLSAIPVVIFSNLGQQEEIARAKALGAAAFYVKVNLSPNDMVKEFDKFLQ